MSVDGRHVGGGVFEGAADCCYEIVVREGGFDYAAAYVACGAEDLYIRHQHLEHK